MLYERSKVKGKIVECLRNWEYQKRKCSSYEIARKIDCSQDMVGKILRYLKDVKIVEKSKGGSYHLI